MYIYPPTVSASGCHSYEYIHINNRHKGICRWSSKAKPFPPTKKQIQERENGSVSDSDEDGLEMRDVVVTVEKDKDNYCFEGSSTIGIPSIFNSLLYLF